MLRFLAELFHPFTVFFLATGAGLAYLWIRRPDGRRQLLLVVVPYALLTLVCMPAVSYLAVASLEWPYPPGNPAAAEGDAIVVLAGGMRPPDELMPRPRLDLSTMNRCLHAATIYRHAPRLVVVSGGKRHTSTPGPPAADVMRSFLVDLGVAAADILVENGSRNTYENAVATRKLLATRGIDHVVLVTDATHMMRADLTLRAQGFRVTPSGCGYMATGFSGSLESFLPRPHAASRMALVLHEWAGMVWYGLHGRL